MWSAYALYAFKSCIWMFSGLHVLLIFTVFCRPSLVGFGVFVLLKYGQTTDVLVVTDLVALSVILKLPINSTV